MPIDELRESVEEYQQKESVLVEELNHLKGDFIALFKSSVGVRLNNVIELYVKKEYKHTIEMGTEKLACMNSELASIINDPHNCDILTQDFYWVHAGYTHIYSRGDFSTKIKNKKRANIQIQQGCYDTMQAAYDLLTKFNYEIPRFRTHQAFQFLKPERDIVVCYEDDLEKLDDILCEKEKKLQELREAEAQKLWEDARNG